MGIKRHQFVRNDDVWRLMGQPKLTAIVQSHRLNLSGQIACMDNNADAKRILLALPPKDWRRPRGCPASYGWAPYSRIWDPTISHCLMQWIWPRTGFCGGCGWHAVLCNLELHAINNDDDTLKCDIITVCRISTWLLHCFHLMPHSETLMTTMYYHLVYHNSLHSEKISDSPETIPLQNEALLMKTDTWSISYHKNTSTSTV